LIQRFLEMMKKTFLLGTLYVLLQSLTASNPKPLQFNASGTFKIVQFTDTHISFLRPENSAKTIETMRTVLDVEKPDFVIFTGDNVTDPPVKEGLKLLAEPVVSRHIPYVMLLGNHDSEKKMQTNRYELGKTIRKLPGYYAIAPIKHIEGQNNYVIEVKGANHKKTEALLYCWDSNDYDTIAGKKVYAGIQSDQVEWYERNSRRYTKNNKQPIPSLAFFHVPLPEYATICDTSSQYIGSYKEKTCPPVLNTGMFAAMVKQGDVMGCFVGHDHDNDFVFKKFGILLGYGRFTGSSNTYSHCESGARVIVLQQGKRAFKTWIRLKNGTVINSVNYPEQIPFIYPPKVI
jgi:hypothetical protein